MDLLYADVFVKIFYGLTSRIRILLNCHRATTVLACLLNKGVAGPRRFEYH